MKRHMLLPLVLVATIGFLRAYSQSSSRTEALVEMLKKIGND